MESSHKGWALRAIERNETEKEKDYTETCVFLMWILFDTIHAEHRRGSGAGVKKQMESFSNIQGLQLCLSGDSNVLKCISFLWCRRRRRRATRTAVQASYSTRERSLCAVNATLSSENFPKMHRTNNGCEFNGIHSFGAHMPLYGIRCGAWTALVVNAWKMRSSHDERHVEIVQTRRRRPQHLLNTRIRMRGAAQQHTERSHLILLIKLKSILPRGLAQWCIIASYYVISAHFPVYATPFSWCARESPFAFDEWRVMGAPFASRLHAFFSPGDYYSLRLC